ncbi:MULTISPECIES: Dabb family protein [Rhizobium]|uniref:Dabb family protein n=1 Tax=Rhizobium TaxID=379 RepID=UPI000A205DED|nr:MULTISPECIES: Dabb family protein [Rhizobium]ARO29344.1 stress responsive alpha-beta barrel domain-containing protein [Rhizobium sp. NXC14]MBX5133989.1 Dabb family protein [Rhizobium lentis]MBX5139789.1 Dabb family protein [Rhizobium lentis]MBX5152129.1 Dabb family protein [Rhizobium lentis]MBX5177884.1 Dabb family protein [Rhizobium lentis]
MIRHIVFFTVQEEHLEEVRAGLSILTGIPHARLLEIGTNVKTDQLGTEIDLVVYGEFDDAAALAAYKAHPDYQRSIERVRPLREKRIAADYDSRTAVTQPL